MDVDVARSIFTTNRKRGAPWCLAVAPSPAATDGALVRTFFDSVIKQRMPPPGKAASSVVQLKAAEERNGWYGNLQTKEVAASISYIGKAPEAVWFPDEATAKRWQEYLAAK
jgi:hypothetical protein